MWEILPFTYIDNMELSIADYLLEEQFCIPFLCEEVNSWTEYFTVMVEVQMCTPIQYVEVYNSCKEWFTHNRGAILKIHSSVTEIFQSNYWGTILYLMLSVSHR